MTLSLGTLFIILGIIIILKPHWGDWHSINDVLLKKLYGKRIYYFLLRFVSGPLLIFIGILLILQWTNPYQSFFLRLNTTTSEELNKKFNFEEKTEWNFFNYVSHNGKKLRYNFYYPAFISHEETKTKLSTRVLQEDDIVRIVAMNEANEEEYIEATRIFYGEGYKFENLPTHLSTLYKEDIFIIEQQEYQNYPPVYELITNIENIRAFYLPTAEAFVSFRIQKEFDVIGDTQNDEGLWPYEISFEIR